MVKNSCTFSGIAEGFLALDSPIPVSEIPPPLPRERLGGGADVGGISDTGEDKGKQG